MLWLVSGPIAVDAFPLELIVSVEEDREESALIFDDATRVYSSGQTIISLLPGLMPLFAATRYSAYGGNRPAESVPTVEAWSRDNSQWLHAMLPTLLAVRRKADEAEVLLHARQKEREERTRIAPRAGRPQADEIAGPPEPRIGIRLVDVLLRNSRDTASSIELHVTNGEHREINPFDDPIEGRGVTDYLLSAEIDAATAGRLDEAFSRDNPLGATVSRVVDTVGTVALQFARWDNRLQVVGSSSTMGGVNVQSPMRNLIDVGMGTPTNGKTHSKREVKSTKSIKLTSFLVSIGLLVVTSPITYLVAIPIGFGWVLVRVSRSKRI